MHQKGQGTNGGLTTFLFSCFLGMVAIMVSTGLYPAEGGGADPYVALGLQS